MREWPAKRRYGSSRGLCTIAMSGGAMIRRWREFIETKALVASAEAEEATRSTDRCADIDVRRHAMQWTFATDPMSKKVPVQKHF